jgi:hypothetical protein
MNSRGSALREARCVFSIGLHAPLGEPVLIHSRRCSVALEACCE